jgi:hypothetical protein
MTTIVMKTYEWRKLRDRIDQDYGKATTKISWRLKETLGFTVRTHQGINSLTNVYEYDTRLDFVDETAATFFRMKYL